jgi:hypothetical protein
MNKFSHVNITTLFAVHDFNTRIINIINNNYDKRYFKLVLDENLKNAMYVPHRDVSK